MLTILACVVLMFAYIVVVRLATVSPKKIFEDFRPAAPFFLSLAILIGILIAFWGSSSVYNTPISQTYGLVGFQPNPSASSYYLIREGETVYYHVFTNEGLRSRSVKGSWVIIPTTGSPEVVKHYLVAQKSWARWWFFNTFEDVWYEFRIPSTEHIFQTPPT
jgi:hypothetical protein